VKLARRLLLIFLASGVSGAYADERILSFDSRITVERDGTLEVREQIRVRAEGTSIRHGLLRDFPTIYPGPDGRRVVVGFQFKGATRDGQPEPWRSEFRGNGVRIYVGNPASIVPHGEHTYVLTYRTTRQLGFFPDHDELYWNVTGNGWDFAIDAASATVLLPDDVPAAEIEYEAYTGPQGARGRDYAASLSGGAPTFTTTRSLDPREGLTIVTMWPTGHIMPAVEKPVASPGGAALPAARPARHFDSPAEKLLERDLPRNQAPLYVAAFGLALLLLYYFWIWDRVGRDPPARVVIPQYEMPPNLSAAGMRYLVRQGYDDACFAAAMLSLAVKGYLSIQQDGNGRAASRNFTIYRRAEGKRQKLTEDERELQLALFETGDFLKLGPDGTSSVRIARFRHKHALKRQYASGFFEINGGWHAVGVVFSVLYGTVACTLPGAGAFWPQWHLETPTGWFTIGLLFGGLLANGVYGKLLRAPTVVGQATMDRIRGFKMYLEVAEGKDIERSQGPAPPAATSQLFESYLPAALALDVEQAWAKKFVRVLDAEASNYRPTWYSGGGWDAAHVAAFSTSLGSSLSSAISSAPYSPGSVSGGSDGFSHGSSGGGGGSSGGGGGGGGGGGW
jgi:uncharacterized membrane protein YgcG